MNAAVEVETAGVLTKVSTMTVVALVNAAFALVGLSHTVSTSTARVPSIGGTSLSAVSPDNSNGKELALAGA